MCEASRPLCCALCFLYALCFFCTLCSFSVALMGWLRIHGGYNDHFRGGPLGLSLGW